MSAAATAARQTEARLTASQPLNATLHWSQSLLDAEAGRVDAAPSPVPLAAMPIAINDNIVTFERTASPRGLTRRRVEWVRQTDVWRGAMKAAVYYENGSPDVFRYEDVPDPAAGAASGKMLDALL